MLHAGSVLSCSLCCAGIEPVADRFSVLSPDMLGIIQMLCPLLREAVGYMATESGSWPKSRASRIGTGGTLSCASSTASKTHIGHINRNVHCKRLKSKAVLHVHFTQLCQDHSFLGSMCMHMLVSSILSGKAVLHCWPALDGVPDKQPD